MQHTGMNLIELLLLINEHTVLVNIISLFIIVYFLVLYYIELLTL